MSFRAKLLAFFTLTIVGAVTLVAWGISVHTRRAFGEFDRQRTEALVAQFRQEYAQRGKEIVHRVQGIADAEATLRMAMDLSRPGADASQYYNDARGIAETQQLDFLDIVGDDGTLISSAEWPARFGYKNDWVGAEKDWNSQGAFLRRVDTPDTVELGLLAVRVVRVGEKQVYLVGGQRLNQDFLAVLALPAGMRALFYRNLEPGFVGSALTSLHGPVGQADLFASLITEVQRTHRELEKRIDWTADRTANSEIFKAIPMLSREGDLLGVFLVGRSRQDLVAMLNFIRALALLACGCVILLGLILGWWISARLTRPIRQLAAGAREVATGHWEAQVKVHSGGEIGQLALAFNDMIRQIAGRRERLLQTERVAAWRELARRFAHELKKPLFPLQLTVENLQRAREQTSGQFDEVVAESAPTLRAELENLKTIVGRFSDFAKMAAPEFEPVDLNESVRSVLKLFEPQFSAVGRPPITPELYLEENLPRFQADPLLLRRALENLVLNSLDAMPAGGTLTVRTSQHNGSVRLEFADTGTGLTPEECARLFTPHETDKQHGAGLALAIVQAVVSDHGGQIAVESAPGAGTTFRIELPIEHPIAPPETNDPHAKPADPPISSATQQPERPITVPKFISG
jgi:two-component system nitrogen regulation sensor histidine kinase NtrY